MWLVKPTKVYQISRPLVFIAASFFLFKAIDITNAASGSSTSITHDKISHLMPCEHSSNQARSYFSNWLSEYLPAASKIWRRQAIRLPVTTGTLLALTPKHAAHDVTTPAIEMVMRQTSRNGCHALPMLDHTSVCRDAIFVVLLETLPPRITVVRDTWHVIRLLLYRHRGVIRFRDVTTVPDYSPYQLFGAH